jgi:hypothetical protein
MIPSRRQILYSLEDHIGDFMDIFSYESARRIGDQNVLRKIDALMDWSAISVLLKNGLKRSGLGPQGYKEITLFKCLVIGQWHNLSDPTLEQSLRVRFDFMLFAGLDLHGSAPAKPQNAYRRAGDWSGMQGQDYTPTYRQSCAYEGVSLVWNAECS